MPHFPQAARSCRVPPRPSRAREVLGEAFVVEVTVVPEAGKDGRNVVRAFRFEGQLSAQFSGGVRAPGKNLNGVSPQGFRIQAARRLPGAS